MRSPTSHKTENGIVAVIGGSEAIHGAPLFSALAAEASGVDLVFVALPFCHKEIAKQSSLNFQVRSFLGNELTMKDIAPLTEWLATMDVCVIGPGLTRTKDSLDAMYKLIAECPCPMVLDASALQPWTLEASKGHDAVLTPHLGELERMGIALEELTAMSAKHQQVIHVKGDNDQIGLPDGSIHEVHGGNAGLTVGGTGDTLAGLTAGLIAQRVSRVEASALATTVIKKASELLAEDLGSFTAQDVIAKIPKLMKELNLR